MSGPSRPYGAIAEGAIAWRTISHLSLNYLSLVNATGQQGATALRDLLELYATTADVSARRQIEGIRSVNVRRVVRRLPGRGPIAFGRGLEITVDVDELGFEGGSAIHAGRRARSTLCPLRVDQLGHRDGIAIAESRRDQSMGAKLGHETDALNFLADLAREPYRYDFYQTLRRLECLYRDKPRWGAALRPVDEPLRLGQDPDVAFAPAPLASFEFGKDGAPSRLQVRLFGLLGPNGPMPIHITEYADIA